MGGAASHLEVRGHLALGTVFGTLGEVQVSPVGVRGRAEVRVGVCSTGPTFLVLGVLGETRSRTGRGWYHQGAGCRAELHGGGAGGRPCIRMEGPQGEGDRGQLVTICAGADTRQCARHSGARLGWACVRAGPCGARWRVQGSWPLPSQ